jgi:uncharacterized protein
MVSRNFYIDNYQYKTYAAADQLIPARGNQQPMQPVDFLIGVVAQVASTLLNTWPFLLLGTVSAAVLSVHVGTERLGRLLRKRTSLAVGGSVGAAVLTPFCSCGTTAVVLSLLASAAPWAPIVAFMVASPLSSPTELFLSAGLFGWPFAVLYFVASIALGLAAGAAAFAAERAGLLRGQARFVAVPPAAEPLHVVASPPPAGARPLGIGPGAMSVHELPRPDRLRLGAVARESWKLGRRMLVLFVGFAALGYAVIGLVPNELISATVGGDSPLAVVAAATLGIPFYVSSEASLPLVASLVEGGMGTGPAMAFLVTGAGTSLGAVAGALLIARWRVLVLVVGTLWLGSMAVGLIAGAVL